jgi:hypothetical protein
MNSMTSRLRTMMTGVFSCQFERLPIAAAILLLFGASQSFALTSSGPIVINGQHNLVISGLSISSPTGPCVQIINSTGITIRGSNIGPCGVNNSSQNGWGIYVKGGKGINIYDSYVHVENQSADCNHSHDNIYIINASTITVQGNVIAYGGSNIMAYNANNINVMGNFLLNPRGSVACSSPNNLGGNQFQAWADPATPNQNIAILNNYTVSSTDVTKYTYPGNVVDNVSFGLTNGIVVASNYVVGGQNNSGCGIIMDYNANNSQILDNVLSNNYHCGVSVASGVNHNLSGNKVLLLKPSNASAVGIEVSDDYAALPCSNVSLSGNISYAINSSNFVQGYYSNGSCASLTLKNNTIDNGCSPGNCAAFKLLYPIASTNLPPLIPPQPHSCVASSVYSTQTSGLKCQ